MNIPISPASLDETNLLLRAIWAELRTEFNDLRWQLSPRRHGDYKFISFGYAQLGFPETVNFGITYERKGIATNLVVNRCPEEALPRIEACVRRAEARLAEPGGVASTFRVTVSPSLPFSAHHSASLDVLPLAEGDFHLTIKGIPGFDELDGTVEAVRRARILLDALSFMTNCAFELVPLEELEADTPIHASSAANSSDEPEFDWIDGCPLVNNELTLLAEEWALLERIAADELKGNDQQLLDAAHHFHTGLREERHVGHGITHNSTSAAESAVVAYVSALETAARLGAPEPDNCPTCGQTRYKISARVTAFVEGHLGPVCSSLLKLAYSLRSSYLHEGRLTSSRTYAGREIPQLDPSNPTGVVLGAPSIPLLNIRQYTSYCLRRCLTPGGPTQWERVMTGEFEALDPRKPFVERRPATA